MSLVEAVCMMGSMVSRAGRLWRRIVASDVSATMIGTVAGQAVLIVGSPILTRLYLPAELGGFAIFLGLAATFSVVAPLGYHLAIPLSKNRRVAANVLVLATIAVVSAGLLIALGGLGARWVIPRSPLSKWLWLLGPAVVAICGFQILFYWAAREGAFRRAGVARLFQALAQVVGQVGAGALHYGIAGLVGAYTAAQFVGMGRLWRGASFPFQSIARRRIAVVGRRYLKFPQFTMWGSLANAAGTQLPAVLVGSLFGLAVAGQFSLALRVLALPATLLGRAIAQVFYPKAAAVVAQPAELRRLVDRATGLLFITAVTCFLPVIVLSGDLFATVFGSVWREAGNFGAWIAVWSAVALISSPVSTLYLVAGRQGTGLIFSVADAVVKVSALAIGGWVGGAPIAIKAFAITSALSYLTFHVWTLSLVGLTLWAWLKPYAWLSSVAVMVVVSLTLLRDSAPVLVLWSVSTGTLALVCGPTAYRLFIAKPGSP